MTHILFTFSEIQAPGRRFVLDSASLSNKFEHWLTIRSALPDAEKLKYYATNMIIRAFLADTDNGGLAADYQEQEGIFTVLGPLANVWKNC